MHTNSPLLNLSSAQLRKAADLKERIDVLNDELAGILSGAQTASGPIAPGNRAGLGRRKMSAAGRARIGAAARARWARIHAEQAGGAKGTSANANGSPDAKPKRTMSASARKKIAAAARARWARVKAAKG
jgi:hypothetical protein